MYFKKIIIVWKSLVIYSFFFFDSLIAFSWIFRFIRDLQANWLSLVLHKYLVLSCIASLKINFLEISLPQTFDDNLGVEYGMFLMMEKVEFVLVIIFSDCIISNIKILVVSVFSPALCKSSKLVSPFITKKHEWMNEWNEWNEWKLYLTSEESRSAYTQK